MKLREKLWLWGQEAGSHHWKKWYNLPGYSRMTPVEGAFYFGIPNMCRVVMSGMPRPPFDQDSMVMDQLHKVVWSIVGDGGSGTTDYTDEVLRMAREYPNVVGAIVDDFFDEQRMKDFPPEKIMQMKERLKNGQPRPMDFISVIYTHELTEERRPFLAPFEKISLWTWSGSDLAHLEENYAKLKNLIDDQPILVGAYMYDYGYKTEMQDDYMRLQLDTYYKWLKEGKIEGIIFCSNCCADLGFSAVKIARDWIREHGDEELED